MLAFIMSTNRNVIIVPFEELDPTRLIIKQSTCACEYDVAACHEHNKRMTELHYGGTYHRINRQLSIKYRTDDNQSKKLAVIYRIPTTEQLSSVVRNKPYHRDMRWLCPVYISVPITVDSYVTKANEIDTYINGRVEQEYGFGRIWENQHELFNPDFDPCRNKTYIPMMGSNSTGANVMRFDIYPLCKLFNTNCEEIMRGISDDIYALYPSTPTMVSVLALWDQVMFTDEHVIIEPQVVQMMVV